jgi:hypothetical protein
LLSSGTKWLPIMTYIHPPVIYSTFTPLYHIFVYIFCCWINYPFQYVTTSTSLLFIFYSLYYFSTSVISYYCLSIYILLLTRRGRDRVVVGYTTTFAISAYHQIKLWVRILPVKLYTLCAFLSFSQFTCTNSCHFSAFPPDACTFNNIYKLQKHVLLRHQSYLIVFGR